MTIQSRSRRTNKTRAKGQRGALDARTSARPAQEVSAVAPAAALRAAKLGLAAELAVPVTLGEICNIIGRDCKPESFGSTALETLAGQLDGLTSIADNNEGVGTYDQWRVVDNVVARMRLAASVTAWLESETGEAAANLPQVQP